jgi:hypothetical protein
MKLSASAFRQQPIDARAADAGAFAISVAPQAPAPSRTWEASRRAISAPVFTSHSRIVLSRTALSFDIARNLDFRAAGAAQGRSIFVYRSTHLRTQ